MDRLGLVSLWLLFVIVFVSAGCAGVATTTNPPLVAPTITVQPAAQTVTAGQAATFTVVATGTAPLRSEERRDVS